MAKKTARVRQLAAAAAAAAAGQPPGSAASHEVAAGSDIAPADRYAGYMSLYIRLDEALWQAIQFVAAVTAVGFAFVGGIVGGGAALAGMNHNQTVAVGLLPIGVLVMLGSLSLRRIREDTRHLVKTMISLEGTAGGERNFFEYRGQRMDLESEGFLQALRRHVGTPSATLWYSWVFAVTGFVLIAYAVVQLVSR
jgi:hypothetical protein